MHLQSQACPIDCFCDLSSTDTGQK